MRQTTPSSRFATTYTDLTALLHDVQADPEVEKALKGMFQGLQFFGSSDKDPHNATYVHATGEHLVNVDAEELLPDLCPYARGWIDARDIYHVVAIIPAPTHVVAALGVKLGTLTNQRLKLASNRYNGPSRPAEPPPQHANGRANNRH